MLVEKIRYMNIAVIDVAAIIGGALSVLNDFCDEIKKNARDGEQWYIITSVVDIEENSFVHNIKFPEIKKSWLHRLKWERIVFPKLMKELDIDVVFSLQNNALPKGSYKQVVYFHNVLLIQKWGSYLTKENIKNKIAIYVNILGPYIRNTWKQANIIIVQGISVKNMMLKFVNRNKIKVIRSRVNVPDEYKDKAGMIKGYIYPTSAFNYKNIESIIEAEKILNGQGKDIEILVTIDGSENEYAKRIVNNAKKVRGIKFIGWQQREHLYDLYAKYGLIQVSKLESLPVPILEAKKIGTVIVGLNEPYVVEAVGEYKRALIASNIEELCKNLEKGLDLEKGHISEDTCGGWLEVISTIRGQGYDNEEDYC